MKIHLLFVLATLTQIISTLSSAKQPNIIILLADDLGYGELGCYGQEMIKTPVLDSMAKGGMVFTDFYAGTSVCAPSRASLITGKHAGNATVKGNRGYFGENIWARIPLRKDEVTIGEMMQSAGYETAFIGKWHVEDPNDLSTWAFARGFDYSVQVQWPSLFGGTRYDTAHHYVGEKESIITYNAEENDCIDSFRTDLILEYLDTRDAKKPLFLFMSYRSPHANERYIRDKDRYADKGWPETERIHAARVTMLDEQVGRLMSKLKDQGELEKTLIIFTSDNGPHNEGGHNHEFFNSNGELRGYKRDLYEGGIRVPMIAYWPGKIPAGRSSDHPAAFCDIMATAADVAGIQIPMGVDGISFYPALQRLAQPKHDHLHWILQLDGWNRPLPDGGFRQAVRMGHWKGVRYGIGNAIELYNLANDWAEQHNIAEQHPIIVSKIAKIMMDSYNENEYYPFGGVLQEESAKFSWGKANR